MVVDTGDEGEAVAVLVGDDVPVGLVVDAVLLVGVLVGVLVAGLVVAGLVVAGFVGVVLAVVDVPGVAPAPEGFAGGVRVLAGAIGAGPCCSKPTGARTGDPWPKC